MKNEKESKQPIVALEEHYKHILELIGEDCNRPGLERTPQRVAQAMCELTSGYNEDPSAELINSSFKEEYQRMVIVKDIRFFSMCEHHLLPFYGKVHVAYIPNQLVTGLSKIARVVDIFSHRLQVQERFTREIKECIENALQPQGVIVFRATQRIYCNDSKTLILQRKDSYCFEKSKAVFLKVDFYCKPIFSLSKQIVILFL